MRLWASRMWREIIRTVQRPSRILKLGDRDAWRRRRALVRSEQGEWHGTTGLRSRTYTSRESYIEHQRSKATLLSEFVEEVDALVERVVGERLEPITEFLYGKAALCLGARGGGEVRAFRSHGSFAIGIDLAPLDRKTVLEGDFHHLDFPSGSVDLVFTNSLDHALELPVVANEIRRVLKPDGYVILEIIRGEAEGGEFGRWEATRWSHVDDVIDIFRGAGFVEAVERRDFDQPWAGQQCLLRAVGATTT